MTATTRRARLLVLLFGLAALALAVTAAAMWPARAAAADKGATTLTMAAPKPGVGATILLTAKLAGPDGKPVANAPIQFVFQVDVLGQTEALLGTTPTTSGGTATWVYRLQQDGPVAFAAHFKGSDTLAAATSQPIPYVVTGAPAPVAPEAPRIGLVGQWVPWAALVLLLGVWVTLIGVAVRTVTAIPSAARGFAPGPVAAGELATQGWQTGSELESD